MASLSTPRVSFSDDPPKFDKAGSNTPSPSGDKKRPPPASTPGNVAMKVPRQAGVSPSMLQTPTSAATGSSGAGASATVPYSQRKNAQQVVVDLKATIAAPAADPVSGLGVSGSRCAITTVLTDATVAGAADVPVVGVANRYRHMFTTLEQRAAALEQGFQEMQTQLMHHANLPPHVVEARAPVGVPSQDTVVNVGRICCEASEGKINKMSVLLEGGRMEGGQRIKLQLDNLQSYALFPGQYVVVEGINSSGTRMVVKNLCEGVPRPLPRSAPSELIKFHANSQPLRIAAAAGPFCCSSDLDYEPLSDLLHNAKQLDVLVLCGPFVDVNHPKLSGGDVDIATEDGTETVDYDTFFNFKISGVLETLYEENPDTKLQVVLVPSLHDANHDYVFPQPPFADRVDGGQQSPFFPEEKLFTLDIPHTGGLGEEKRVHCVSNPALIKLNEVVVGVTSTDVLMTMGKAEIAQRPMSSNRLGRLAEHLLKQQSFAPLFPSNGGVAGEPVPIDMTKSDKLRMPVSPDVLLVPSRLATFARKLDNGTLVVNPGQLARGTGGGTFASLTINGLPKEALEQAVAKAPDTPIAHQVAERTDVQIRRI